MLPRTIEEWYRLSEHGRAYFEQLPALGCAALTEMLARDCSQPPEGELRMSGELRGLERAVRPEVAELQRRGSAEQTLQWMFDHRGYFHREQERVVWREWPTSCAGRETPGRCDLLLFDAGGRVPVLVELKKADANDALTRVVLEALRHWIFAMRHRQSFDRQMGSFGYTAAGAPRVAIAAPSGYFRRSREMNRQPRGREFDLALDWMGHLRRSRVVDIGVYEIADDWQAAGPAFGMRQTFP